MPVSSNAALHHGAARQALLARAQHVLADDARAAPVPSPCVSVCQMDGATGLCAGCLRSLPEIGAWSGLGEAARREVWLHLAHRAQQLPLPPAAT